MTQDQIEYAKLLEDMRAHRASEALEHEKSMVTHLNTLITVGESTRHNQATESLEARKQEESERHNVVGEQETMRHNVATEEVQQREAAVKEQSLVETNRHNLVTEFLTSEAQAETQRHNIAEESRKQAELEETTRYHDMSVGLGYAELSESARYHDMMYSLDSARLREQARSNRANETINLNRAESERIKAMASYTSANAAASQARTAAEKQNFYEDSVWPVEKAQTEAQTRTQEWKTHTAYMEANGGYQLGVVSDLLGGLGAGMRGFANVIHELKQPNHSNLKLSRR